MAESVKLSNNEAGEEDRLSSLPDAILIDILSRIPINFAASTSVLSHRWRNLWTAVTRFELSPDPSDFTAIVEHILGQLTFPNLTEFKLYLSSPLEFPEQDVLESCFRRVCDRFVEKVLIDVLCSFYEEVFWVPVCLFNSQSLVVLELGGKLSFDLESPGNGVVIHLPNLKKLKLDFLLDVPIWLGALIRFCPLLEDLHLVFKLDVVESEIVDCVDILGLNLKSLKIDLASSNSTKRTKFSIDAPKLATLEILDCYSYYYFVHDPSALVNACIDLRRDDEFEEDEERDDDDYHHWMSKCVRAISCASNLDLKLDIRTNILPVLCCLDDGFFPIFHNLTRFEITLTDIGLSSWKDLLLSLQYFPNLKHLKVMVNSPSKHNNWCPPNYVPGCLVSTLKTVQIWGLDGVDDELKMLGYILCNASHLEELHVHKVYRYFKEEREKAYALWKERQFCKSLFKLPRMSSTCEVVFSGRFVTVSSNTFKNGCITCQMYLDD